jgi:dimethylhistidine N-methyltransferase
LTTRNSRALEDAAPDLAVHREQILAGLTADQKQLEPQFLYDERGSELFERITALSEYYPTRTELRLLETHGREIARLVGPEAAVIELGAGSIRKARVLLHALDRPTAYVPVDISADYLARQAAEISRIFPALAVVPLAADFTKPLRIPRSVTGRRTLLFFPGSTIGNLTRDHALALLAQLRQTANGPSALLIGVDICSDVHALHRAYNDASGVTSAFNLNLLARLNRELGANFDLDAFEHAALYDEREARIEMRLISRRRQTVNVAGATIEFLPGEYLITEHSHKYAPEGFSALAAAAGWNSKTCWIDSRRLFSVHYLSSDQT